MASVLKINDFDDPDFDPFGLDESAWGEILDPYPIIAAQRRKGAVQPIEYRKLFTDVDDPTLEDVPTFSVFGHDEVMEVLINPKIYSNTIMMRNLGLAFGETIVVLDPPEHTGYRRIFQKAFLPNTIRQWGDEIVNPVIAGLFDRFAGRGKADLVQEFTVHYPFQIIYRQLGLPDEDGRIFHKLAAAQILWASHPQQTAEAGRKLGAFFKPLIAERRNRPNGDLISLLANAEADGEYLPEELVTSFLRQLINAAGDTTYRTTGTLLMCLLNHPEQLEAVREDRSLVPHAIEEALRWDGPVLMTWRMATQDTVLGGVEIPKGAVINVISGSANRDETRFEEPDSFDIFRSRSQRHFGFGTGPHVCIGQHLARLEMQRALTAILDRLPNLRLDPDYPPPVSKGFSLRTPSHIHVRFD